MKYIVGIFLFLGVAFNDLSAQEVTSEYKTSFGIKSLPGGLSYKHFIKEDHALEGLFYFDRQNTRVTGLYEFHYPIYNVLEGLKWYIGGGAHISKWTNIYKSRNPTRTNNNQLGIGLDGVIGVDYKVDALPINISFDWQPSLNILGYTYYEGLTWGGVAIRYTF